MCTSMELTSIVAHFHYTWSRRGDGISRRDPFLVAENFRQKISQHVGGNCRGDYFYRIQPDVFFPQFMLGYLGMPRRYAFYPAEFQVLNVMSSAGATVLGVGYLIPLIYLMWSMRYGPIAEPNPWGATGLEWKTASPHPRKILLKFP